MHVSSITNWLLVRIVGAVLRGITGRGGLGRARARSTGRPNDELRRRRLTRRLVVGGRVGGRQVVIAGSIFVMILFFIITLFVVVVFVSILRIAFFRPALVPPMTGRRARRTRCITRQVIMPIERAYREKNGLGAGWRNLDRLHPS